ncbi:MAG: ParB/RepB/Spo0J family partition protein [Candidatus Omnitrophica bacterium]|nr:ParB/RepB/Spo0J family partition protein [Candidatus Omnitrophota bacterium]
MSEERKSLGRGLKALIRDLPEVTILAGETGLASLELPPQREALAKALSQQEEPLPKEGFRWLEVGQIKTGKHQPRTLFNPESIRELSASIKEKGVIQPIVVRKTESSGEYELIAGERRFLAAQQAGLEKIPVVIRNVSDGEALEIALIENIQRENLNPIEEGKAYQRLSVEFAMTQEQIGQKVGKDRATVANAIRLLSLPQEIQQYLLEGKLQAGHARAILMVKEETAQLELARRIIRENLTVRQAERWAAPVAPKAAKQRRRKNYLSPDDPHLLEMEEKLSKRFGTKVKIETARVGGRIIVEFYSLDDFERITKEVM